ncbi:MAG TPA: phosphate acyltransferase [Candidatus Krumholzibacteria bacterium]|nr:phosphate acyltransferase [Candidatus Krumholzibacteria bacterium]HPD71817.1 phosphate acyltransferase [Candidatus Krumholzibacteria bacterium]HRY41250.1 phosphate acyltransferase [Candidatus Krumholzibacteria bacterium]
MIRREEALQYHAGDRSGKIAVVPSKSCVSPREVRLAYLPGAVFAAQEIGEDPAAAWRYTARGNLVAVVTNGTAVPGLGNVGPAAAKPIQEGMAVLFKRLADIDVFDLELDATDPERIVETVRILEPTFGGINLKDLRAPEGLAVYDRLREALRIPVFHENLYSTAVVAIAALINALELADKTIADARIVICGAGTVGLGCARLVAALGVPRENLLLYDVHGLVHPDREDLNPYQRAFARAESARTLAEGMRGADAFLGASAGGVVGPELVRSMNRYPIIFAMATPDPEIGYDAARAVRHDAIVGTSLNTSANAIVDLLSFPYIFRGALDVQASTISEGMMLAAARSLAELAREEVPEEVSRAYGDAAFTFGPEYLLPKPIDPRILVRQSSAVARQAMEEGLAARPVDAVALEESLTVRLGTGRELLRQLIIKARRVSPRVVLPEGANETILRASVMLMDEGIAHPVLLGDDGRIRRTAQRLGIDLGGAAIVDPVHSPQQAAYAEAYFRLRGRRGMTMDLALDRILQPKHFGTMMLHTGDADLMICGIADHYAETMRTVIEVIGPASGVRRISSLQLVLRPKEVYFLADCAVNIEPSAEDLAEIALLSAQMVRSLGIEPRVAMLSYSNFGSVENPQVRKVREATRLARRLSSSLVIEGEVQLETALDGDIRRRYFPFSDLTQNANILIFPDLQSGNLALHLLQKLGDAVVVGPVLMGTRRPVHVIQYGAPAQDVVHLAAIGALQIADAATGIDART